MRSGLSAQVLGRIWGLSDYDKDGQLTKNEFNVAMKVNNSKNTLPSLSVNLF